LALCYQRDSGGQKQGYSKQRSIWNFHAANLGRTYYRTNDILSSLSFLILDVWLFGDDRARHTLEIGFGGAKFPG
jgi:hypothetical protein